MKLMIGLGNPGPRYAGHRHNIGFMAVDAIANDHGFGPERARFQALTRDGTVDGHKVLILKPTTYMNDSGRAVGEAARFFKVEPEDVFVFHDELDLAARKIRAKKGGGAAGHNGIKSIAAHLGPDFWRIRLGIGHPGQKDRVSGHVLGDFSKAERSEWVDLLLDEIARAAPCLVGPDPQKFAAEIAQRLAPPPPAKPKPSDRDETGPPSRPPADDHS